MSSSSPRHASKRAKRSSPSITRPLSTRFTTTDPPAEEEAEQLTLQQVLKQLEESHAKISALEQVNATIKQENATIKQENATIKQENATIKQENATIKQEQKDSSLWSVISGSELQIPNSLPRGLPESHSRPKNQIATAFNINFATANIHALNDQLGGLELEKCTSMLRALIDRSKQGLIYWNEYDVQDFIQNALRDAVEICNRIIAKILYLSRSDDTKTRPAVELGVRRESSLFSSIVDHAVVFDLLSGAPVFTVETKKHLQSSSSSSSPASDGPSLPTGAVIGQIYDQLREMHAKGHPNPFGALTCYNETYIVCLDNCACRNVLKSLVDKDYPHARLEEIIKKLGPLSCNVQGDFSMTQSPLQEMDTVTDWNDVDHQEKASAGDRGVVTPPQEQGFKEYSLRECLRSQCFTPEDLVTAFVSAILCSLDGYQKPHSINCLERGQPIKLEALCMDKDSYSWGMLKTTCQGPLKMTSGCCDKLYLVDHLGTGATSKVYRALTEDGYDCVVKMYIKRLNDNKEQLKQTKFEENGKAAITREYNAYIDIYGDELKDYVWTQTLNGLHCLVHPYFKHVEKSCRQGLMSLISKRLKLFVPKDSDQFYAFDESDQLWQHIGCFNGKLYLFDLGDLQGCPSQEADDKIQSHCDRLMSRLGTNN